MSGDTEFASPQHVGLDSRSKNIQDQVDYASEIIGVGTGRIARFLPDDGIDIYGEDKQKKQERRHLSMLEQLMLDATYKAAYDTAIRTLYETQNAVYQALIQSGEDLQIAEAKHAELLSRASTMPDGSYVFLDDDGSAYTEDGRKLTEDEFVQVDWKENSPSWSEFKDSKETVDTSQKHHDDMHRHSERLEEIEHEIRDAENPPSKERAEELTKEMEEITSSIDTTAKSDLNISVETPTYLPTLNL